MSIKWDRDFTFPQLGFFLPVAILLLREISLRHCRVRRVLRFNEKQSGSEQADSSSSALATTQESYFAALGSAIYIQNY